MCFFVFKQKTAYEMRMSDWSSDVCSSDRFIQRLDLPHDLLTATGKPWVDQIVRRVAGEKASEMRRHAPARQLGLYAIYLMSQEAQLTDAMIDQIGRASWRERVCQ